jgi:hypothetical protein
MGLHSSVYSKGYAYQRCIFIQGKCYNMKCEKRIDGLTAYVYYAFIQTYRVFCTERIRNQAYPPKQNLYTFVTKKDSNSRDNNKQLVK